MTVARHIPNSVWRVLRPDALGRISRGRPLAALAAGLAGLIAAGCASTKVTDRQPLVTEKLPRPANVWVYDFAATAGEIPAESALAQDTALDASMPQTAEQLAEGRELGALIATKLIERIRILGLPAQPVTAGAVPQVGDLVLRGYLVSITEGSAAKRVAIGFGAGSSELRTVVEGFQVTAQGLRRLGFGTLDSTSGKTPGGAMGAVVLLATSNPAGLIVSTGMKVYGEASGKSKLEGRAEGTAQEIAAVLEQRFQEQGWVQ